MPEQADLVLAGPVDEQVAQGMTVAFDRGREGIISSPMGAQPLPSFQ